MAIHVASVDGMGAVTEPTPGTFQTTGMGAEDHMVLESMLFEAAGVNKADDYFVEENGSPNMSVNVNPGQALAHNDSYADNSVSQTRFWAVTSDGVVNVAIDTADASLDRIDLVALKKTANTPNDDGDNVFEIVSSADDANLKGTPAVSPVAPTPSGDYTIFAQVLVQASATTILDADITDRRIFFNPNTNGGWLALGETLVYSSAADPIYTVTIPGDYTNKITKGAWIRLKQGGNFKFFEVVESTYSNPNTTFELDGRDDYDVANASITDAYYSNMRFPGGLPFDDMGNLPRQNYYAEVTGTQSVASGTQKITGGTEVADPSGMHSSGDFTVPTKGVYHLSTGASLSNMNGGAEFDMFIYVNGAATDFGSRGAVIAPFNTFTGYLTVGGLVTLNAGDVVSFRSSHDNGSNKNVNFTNVVMLVNKLN